MRVGVEVGGTFTDLVAVEGGKVVVTKVPSTPRSPDVGAFAALTASGIDLAKIEDLGHGSTVATNAVLERKGAAVAFVATAGFRDLLFMQRHDRRNIYDLFYAKPSPPVRRKDCFEASERISADGSIEKALDEAAVKSALIPAIKAGSYRAVAICLLNAYANPVHEKRLAALITEALPDVLVTASHQVAREFREFERASTTLLSAYVQPVIDGYLHRFEAKLADSGFKGRFTVMQSNGGRLPAEAMRESAITALYSGPAAGVVGATRQAARSGFDDLITFDMGGTSTDVCLVQDGRPSLASESEIDGLPIRTPVLDIVSVGAGGGSIAWVDDGGMLRVGPQSAGADPGPACYGKGGTEPATTDAHIVIGTIRPGAFLGGAMNLDGDAAKRAFEPLAQRFDLSVEQAASSALQLADANIVRAIQLVSTERGRDPRDYALVPFGGAGPLACSAHRRGARHLDHRRATQCRRDLGLRPGRLGLHQVRCRHAQDEARRCGGQGSRPHLRRDAHAARRTVRRHEAAGRPRIHPHARHALRRPGLRGRRRSCRPIVWARSTRPISPSCSPTPITAPSCTAPRSTGRSRS